MPIVAATWLIDASKPAPTFTAAVPSPTAATVAAVIPAASPFTANFPDDAAAPAALVAILLIPDAAVLNDNFATFPRLPSSFSPVLAAV